MLWIIRQWSVFTTEATKIIRRGWCRVIAARNNQRQQRRVRQSADWLPVSNWGSHARRCERIFRHRIEQRCSSWKVLLFEVRCNLWPNWVDSTNYILHWIWYNHGYTVESDQIAVNNLWFQQNKLLPKLDSISISGISDNSTNIVWVANDSIDLVWVAFDDTHSS